VAKRQIEIESPAGYGQNILSSLKKHFFPFIFFVLIGLTLFVFVQQQAGMQLFGHDMSLQGYGETFMKDVMAGGRIPYWNPYIFCGMPHMATMNGATLLFPTALILLLMKLPLSLYFLAGVSITISLSGFFMYLFIQSLGLSRLAGMTAGVFFALCGSLVSYINPGHDTMMFATSMIPIVFFFLTKGLKEEKLVYYVLAGCMLGVQALSTIFQVVFYTVICLAAYFIFSFFSEKKKLKHIGFFAVTGLIALMIAAIQMVQSYYYIKHSFRSGVDYSFFISWSMHPLEAITYIYPKFFGFMEDTYWGRSPFMLSSDYLGILTLFLAAAGAFFVFKDRRVKFFIIFAACVFVLSLGGYTPIYKLLYKIPVVNGFRNPLRWLGLFSFAVITLSAFGFESISGFFKANGKEAGVSRYFIVGALGFAVLSLLALFVFSLGESSFVASLKGSGLITKRFPPQSLDVVSQVIIQMIRDDILLLVLYFSLGFGLVFLVLKGKIGRGLFFAGCLVLVFADNGTRFFLPRTFEAGGNQIRVQAVKTEPAGQEDTRRTEIRNALNSDKSLYRVLPMGDLFNKNWFVEDRIQSCGGYHSAPLEDYNAMQSSGALNDFRFIDLLNVKYFLSETAIDHPYLKLMYDGKVKVYQNITAFPRAFLVPAEETVPKEQVFMKMKEPTFDPRKKLILNEEMKEQLEPATFLGNEVKLWSFEENEIKMQSESKTNAMLFLSETYYPEWKAYVDGVETKIYLADGFFRAIYLPKGKHAVTFSWSPKVFYAGAGITLLGVVLVMLSIAMEILANTKKQKPALSETKA